MLAPEMATSRLDTAAFLEPGTASGTWVRKVANHLVLRLVNATSC